MGTVGKKDSESDEDILKSYFYYHLWKDRLNWTRHVVPILAYDTSTGFFIESYISVIPLISDIETQEVELKYQFLPTNINDVFNVRLVDIYPSSRHLSQMDAHASLTIFNKFDEFRPKKKIPLHKLPRLFKSFYGNSFTISELESMLNNKITDDVKEKLKPSGEKLCAVTASIETAYSGLKEEKPIKSDSELLDTSKVRDDIQTLYQDYNYCTSCSLGVERKERSLSLNITPGRQGNTPATSLSSPSLNKIVIIGEAPGMQEETSGIAFNPGAPAGGVLDKVLKAAKINTDQYYLTNSVLCRPASKSAKTQNGKPTVDHIQACSTRLKNELAILRPAIVVVLGKIAYRAFFGKDPAKVIGASGWKDENQTIYFAPHPSYVVRELSFADAQATPKIKAQYLKHFQTIKERLNSFNNS